MIPEKQLRYNKRREIGGVSRTGISGYNTIQFTARYNGESIGLQNGDNDQDVLWKLVEEGEKMKRFWRQKGTGIMREL